MKLLLLISGFVFLALASSAQCPISNFSVPASACKAEKIRTENFSSDADIFEWYFCGGGLKDESPSAQDLVNLTGNSPSGLTVVEDNGYFFLFIANRGSDDIVKISLGNDLSHFPTGSDIENLGNIDDSFDGPEHIKLVQFESNWIAFIANYSSNTIARINLGNSLSNLPNDISSELLTIPEGVTLSSPSQIEIIEDNDDFHLFASSRSGGTINRLDLGASLLNQPISGANITISGSSGPRSFSFEKDCSTWYGLITSENNGAVHQLTFNSGASDMPDIKEVSLSGDPMSQPLRITLVNDSNEFEGLISTRSGSIFRFSLGENLSSTNMTLEDLGDFSIFTNTFGFDLIFDGESYRGFGIKSSSPRNLSRIDFNSICGANIKASYERIPDNLEYSEEGSHTITLKAINSVGDVDYYSQSVIISNNTAPPISFTDNSNECLGQENTFTPSDMELVSYDWSFDGGITSGLSSTADTTHTFSQAGDSIVFLTVSDGTCTNFAKDTISIFPEPVAPTFSTPGAPYCTGADLAFENLFDESNYSGATLAYDWNYNGEGSSSERDGSFSFETEGTKTILVTASIPGCSTPSAGTDITLIAGPDVNFSFEDLCVGSETQFTNTTTGSGINGQTWNFGDGSETSSVSSPSHTYEDYGTYNVSLTVNNTQGCSNELILPVPIDDKPVAAFNQGPACEGVDISFLDESSVEGLANITNYDWDFDGLGTSNEKDPTFSFENQGTYDVALIVQTTAGCSDTIVNPVNVQLAPIASFDVNLGCINTETIFLDQSEGDFSNPITQWVWTIDGSLASYSSSFGEVYNEPGEHTVSLLVRSANSCQAISDDSFTISELPVADFTVESACDNEQTIFQDASNSSPLEIASYSWAFDNQGTSTSNPATHQFTNAGSYTVELSVLDETGCEGSIQKTVTINPSPTAIMEVSTDIGPAPLTIDFTNQTQGVVNASSWLFGDDEQSTSSESNPQFIYSVEGDYTSQLITTNDLGCSDTTSIAITVADPILDLELVQISTEESQEKTNITLTVKNSGNVILNGFDIRIDLDNNSSIFESYSGTLTRGEQITYPLNFTFSSVGNNIGYACITLIDRVEEIEDINIVNNEGCIDFDQKLVIEDSYPNPVQNTDTNIRLNMILPADAPVQIFLLDASGAVLYQEVYMDAKAGLNSFFVDIYSFKQGMYFIKTVYDQNESTQRFVKL